MENQGTGTQATETRIYCVKCKQKQPAKNVTNVVLKNGRNALKGLCSVCETTVHLFLGTKAN